MMSVLSSLLVLACVCVSLVVATSESNHNHDHLMIANHFTSAAAAHSHSFRTLQTSSGGISAACQTTTTALEANTDIQAAKRAVIASGCTNPGTQQSCSTTTRTCTCIATYSNDANLRSLVAQAGGQVCSMGMQFTAYSTSVNVDFNYQGFGGLTLIGSSCTNTDIQTMLSTAFDAIAEGIRESSAKSSSSNKINSLTGTLSLCSTSYFGTRSTNGAYNNNQPIGIAIIALLIGTIITIINQAL